MHFDLLQTLSLAGKASVPNDDRIGCAARHAWVIDGATDLGPPGLLGPRGGAAWLAGTAHRAFSGATGALAEVCETVFNEVEATWAQDRLREPLAEWELPRASFAAVAVAGNTLLCSFLSDCVVLHVSQAGVAFLTPAPDRAGELAEAAALGPGAMAGGLRSPAVLADRRAARQRPKAVLGVSAQSAREGLQTRQVPVCVGDELVLMSDGFAALFDTYQACDAAGFVAQLQAGGLLPLAEQLRRIEHEDFECQRYPRFKASDDASALWLRVG